MFSIRLVVALVVLNLSIAHALAASNKLAFVVGVNEYTQLRDANLPRTKADARAISDALVLLGYEVRQPDSGTLDDVLFEWGNFINDIKAGSSVVIYFSGHGIGMNGRNYLLPSDVPSLNRLSPVTLDKKSFVLSEWLQAARSRHPDLIVAIIDACRNNPFAVSGKNIGSARTKGLVPVQRGRGRFVMFSADEGQVALENTGPGDTSPYSLYTRKLLPLLKNGNSMSLSSMAVTVNSSVRAVASTIRHEQDPAYYDKSSGSLCITGDDCSKMPAPRPPAPTASGSHGGQHFAIRDCKARLI